MRRWFLALFATAGMTLAAADYGIFLNADATPQNAGWLRPLVLALQDERTAAVFGRQVPRSNCQAVYAHDYERCFGPHRESTRWEHFFSMVSSGSGKVAPAIDFPVTLTALCSISTEAGSAKRNSISSVSLTP